MLKKHGFTLLEVLLSALIISVGVMTLIWVFSSGLSATAEVENMGLALNIAQANMELIKNKTFTQIDTTSEVQALVSNLGFTNFNVTGAVTDVVSGNLIQEAITVGWNVKGGTGSTSTTLTTLVANY
jgi:prepilin-type N-terminal cleavage/methylation domain-containing protein